MTQPDPPLTVPVDEARIAALRNSANRASAMLKELSNEQRLLILCRLAEGESSVSEISQYLGLGQSATSQHLARLRHAGILATRRDAQTIYYSLADPATIVVLDALCSIFAPEPDLHRR